jgi:hypothetical protein
VGIELGDGLGDGGGLELGVAALGVAVLGVLVLGVVVLGVLVLGVAVLGVLVLGVLVPEAVGAAGLVPPGENEGGDGGPPEQAASDAVARTAKAAQPRTVPRKRRRP